MQNVMIGCDPEMFVTDGMEIVHSIGIIGGTKSAPLKVGHGALQEDNVLLEFNTDPTDVPELFLQYIRETQSSASDRIRSFGLRIVPNQSSHIYPSMEGFPDSAFEFGCTPDYNGLTGEVNPSPTSVNPNLRTAGGHVHIGWDHFATVTPELQGRVGVMCDYFLGLPSLLKDSDDLRRELYGKACAIRYKPYGVEYRTLSNFWIWNDDDVKWVFHQAQAAYNAAVSYGDLLMSLIPPQDVQRVINTNDRAAATAMLEVIENATQSH